MRIDPLMVERKSHRGIEGVTIAVVLAAITAAHYLTPPDYPLLHDIYRRLYYVPIVWSAIRFGLKGGLIVSATASLVFLPHIFHRWGTIPLMMHDALFEILLYNAIATVTGLLANLERHHRLRLEQANIALVRADQMKQLGEIAAGMAHEIRNPLASLRGGVELLGKESASVEDRAEVTGLLVPEIERIERAIKSFLAFARPEEASMQPVDIGRIATDVHELLKKSTGNGVELTLEIDPDLPGMKADPSQMRSVLMNLTLNAIAACEGRENGGRVDVQLRRKAGDVAIRVSDNGKGIPENLKDQIYEPFFTTRKDGLGLGLAIVKRIVDYHGGKIQLKSKPEEGTTFEVTLKGDGK